MLQIFPEERVKAFPMIFHKWIIEGGSGKNHICDSDEKNQRELTEKHAILKSSCVFYRDLKDFDDTINDADSGEDYDENDELADENVGFRNCSLFLRTPATYESREVSGEELCRYLYRLR